MCYLLGCERTLIVGTTSTVMSDFLSPILTSQFFQVVLSTANKKVPKSVKQIAILKMRARHKLRSAGTKSGVCVLLLADGTTSRAAAVQQDATKLHLLSLLQTLIHTNTKHTHLYLHLHVAGSLHSLQYKQDKAKVCGGSKCPGQECLM